MVGQVRIPYRWVVATFVLLPMPVSAALASQSPQTEPVATGPAPASNIVKAGDPTPPPALKPESLREAVIDSLKSNPDIQIALARQDDARFGVDQARAAYLPHVDLQVGYGEEMVNQK